MRPRVRNALPYACDERKKGGDKNSSPSSEHSVELWEFVSDIVLRAREALTGPVNQQPSTAQHNYVRAIKKKLQKEVTGQPTYGAELTSPKIHWFLEFCSAVPPRGSIPNWGAKKRLAPLMTDSSI